MGEWEVGGSGSGLLDVIDKPRAVGAYGVLMEMGGWFGVNAAYERRRLGAHVIDRGVARDISATYRTSDLSRYE